MKLYYPLKKFTFAQRFGQNANPSYAAGGLKGHTADDLTSYYDDTIFAAVDGLVYKIINANNPDLSKYRCVFQLVDDGEKCYEVSYGHLDKILVREGFYAKVGDELAEEGNTGVVYAGGHYVTEAEKESGSKAGQHIHFQVRELRKVNYFDMTKNYISSSSSDTTPYKDSQGNYYLIPNYTNGYNGCIDPAPFYNGQYASDVKKLLITKLLELSNKVLKLLLMR